MLALSHASSAQAPPSGPSAGPGMPPLSDHMLQTLLREKLPPPVEALPPPSPDPRNLEGTWIADQLTQLRLERDMYGNKLPLKPNAQRILDRRVKANHVDFMPYANAGAACRPPGQPYQFGLIYPFQILQTQEALLFVFSEFHTVWGVHMNESRDAAREYMGHSVGHWDGNTLVIETTHYKQPLWIDSEGTPTSIDAHLTFRIRRIDYGEPKLEIVTTVNDLAMYSTPWSIVRTYVWRPDFVPFQEYDCEPQVSPPGALRQYGYQPEPAEAP